MTLPYLDEPLVVTNRPDGIRCGHCKATHPTVADVRACNGDSRSQAASTKQLNYCQSLLRERAVPAEYAALDEAQVNGFSKTEATKFIGVMKAQPFNSRSGFEIKHPDVPEGYYALGMHGGEVMFYKLVDGKYKRLLFAVYGSPGALTTTRITRPALVEDVMTKISADPRDAALLFGKSLGVCGRCGSPLTNAASRDLGIGPVCARKQGW